MYIRSFLQDKQMTITLSGEIDHHEARHAMKTISEKMEAYLPKVCILDFRDVTFMDSSGIALILKLHRRLTETGGAAWVEIAGAQPAKVLCAAGIGRVVKIGMTKEAQEAT